MRNNDIKALKSAISRLERNKYPHVHEEEQWVAKLNVNYPLVDGSPAPPYIVNESFLIQNLERAKFVALWSPTIIDRVIDFLKEELALVTADSDREINKELVSLAKKITRKRILNRRD